jgi:hypothetical protein
VIIRHNKVSDRSLRIIIAVGIILVLIAVAAGSIGAQEKTDDLQAFLRERVGLSKREYGVIDKEVIIKQVDPAGTKREMAVFGIVRIAVSKDFFLEQFRDITNFMHNKKIKQIGAFSNPPGQADVAALELPASDIEELKKCKKGNCKVKLPASAFDRLEEIDWSQGDSTERVRKLFREGVINYVERYRKNGNGVLVEYVDKQEPMSLNEGFSSLLNQAEYVYSTSPGLHNFLKNSPHSAPPGITDFLFWSIEDFGQRPTTTIAQAVIFEGTETDQEVIIVLKQLYATHYFQARLQFIHLVDAPETNQDSGIYFMYLDRILFDADLNKVTRMLISKGLYSHIAYWLGDIRDRLQEKYKNAKGRKKIK